MTTARINGQQVTLPPEVSTPEDLIRFFGLQERPIALELNGILIDRSRYAATALHSGDRIEIVSFVGGG